MLSYLVDETRKLHICGNNPDCSAIEIETGTFKIKGYDGPSLECDKCGAEMQLKSGRLCKYFGCVECSNTRNYPAQRACSAQRRSLCPCPERCEKVEDHYLRDGASGIFHQPPASFSLPKPCAAGRRNRPHACGWTRNSATCWRHEQDPDGNPAVIRYSRKTKEQYVQSELEGKATGWKAAFTKNRTG